MGVDAKLVRAFLRYYDAPFPVGCETGIETLDAALGDFHVDLAEYDAAVGGVVRRLVEGFAVPAEFEHLLTFDEALLERASRLVDAAPEEAREAVAAYERYLRRMKRMLDVARTSPDSAPSRPHRA
jgi:hypothetical protein